jgi:hypothetical protein
MVKNTCIKTEFYAIINGELLFFFPYFYGASAALSSLWLLAITHISVFSHLLW